MFSVDSSPLAVVAVVAPPGVASRVHSSSMQRESTHHSAPSTTPLCYITATISTPPHLLALIQTLPHSVYTSAADILFTPQDIPQIILLSTIAPLHTKHSQ